MSNDWGKSLNRKDGNLRGVEITFYDEATLDNGTTSKDVQGWAVQGDKFVLNYHRAGEDSLEILITEAALERFLDAINALRNKTFSESPSLSSIDWNEVYIQ